MATEFFNKGLAVRKAVLGKEYVEKSIARETFAEMRPRQKVTVEMARLTGKPASQPPAKPAR